MCKDKPEDKTKFISYVSREKNKELFRVIQA